MNKRTLLNWTVMAGAAAMATSAVAAVHLEKGAVMKAASPTAQVGFEVYLPLQNRAGLEALVTAQNTPGSPQYQKWITPAQFAAQFGPSPASVARTSAALAKAGLTVTAIHSRSLHVVGDTQHVSALLGAHLNAVTSPSGATRMVAPYQPSLPSALKAEGATVAAFAPLPTRHPTAIRGPAAPAPANRYTTVGGYWFDDLKQAYSYPSFQKQGAAPIPDGSGVNVAVLMSDLIYPTDVAAAFNHEKFSAISGRPTPVVKTVLVDGGGVLNGGGTFEASLDVQQVTGGAPGASVTLVSIPDLSDQSIIDGYSYIVESNQYDIVNSSFGLCELYYTAAYNGGTDFTYLLQTEHEIYLQGNAQGITFVASSGDEGGPACLAPQYFNGVGGTFIPGVSTPAADPNVTAVGGGNLVTSGGPGLNSAYRRESAFGDPEYPQDPYGFGVMVSGGYWAAGGGISQIFSKPAYQSLVNTGSATKRTVPDVGMQVGGLGFSGLGGRDPGYCSSNAIKCSADDSSVLTALGVGQGGGFYFTIGTSVSSPEFVGALALFEQSVHHRQGNVNFFLYAAGAVQTAAGGVAAPRSLQFFNRGQQGFDGTYSASTPSGNYNYIYGNGSPNPAILFHLNAGGYAGVPQTASNP